MKKIALILALVLALSLVAGCGAGSEGVQSEVYTLDCGFTIEGEKGLKNVGLDGYDAYYSNNDTGFVMLQEYKNGVEMTIEEYAELLCQVNGYDAMTKSEYGLYTTNHTYTDSSMTFWYYTTVHETEDAFIMLQFFCFEKDRETYEPYFAQWSASLTEK